MYPTRGISREWSSRRRLLSAVFVVVLSAQTASGSAQSASWTPAKNVEIIVGVGPGGGIDRTARTVQKILQDMHLLKVTTTVVNKPGGGGTIAQAYLAQHDADAHYLEISATSLLTNQITGKSPNGFRDFTPLAMLYDEYIGFAVRADSPLKNSGQLLNLLRNDPESLSIGIATSAGNTNHIAAGLATKAAGGDVKKLKIVVFSSGGQSMTSLLGGHIGLVVTPSANTISHLRAGTIRVLAIAAPGRIEGPLSAIPTWKEQGVDMVVANWRPILGPRGLSAAQVAFWEQAFARLTGSTEWKKEVENIGGVNHYMNSRQLKEYLEVQHSEFRAILTELGLAK